MMKRLSIALVLIVGLFTACQSEAVSAPPQAVASTPIASLPLNVSLQISTPISQEIIDSADAEYALLTNIYERLAPSVVNIDVIAAESTTNLLDIGRGSGFVFDTDGHIITNTHVINGAQEIEVTFNNGYIVSATVVGFDAYSDLAVIKVDTDKERLFPVTLGNSDSVRVGERAIAIGNPFGLASSMTQGIVSGLGRQLPSAELLNSDLIPGFNNPSIIQVDTDINPGNSGGPLLNSHGEVIGVNTAIRTDTGTFQGVGFAIPVNTVKRVVPELIANGKVDYAWLGISTLIEEDGFSVAGLAEPLNLPVEAGVLVDRVTVGSPADKAGLHGGSQRVVVRGSEICAGGDIIIAVDGIYINNMDELVAHLVVNTSPGNVVNLMIVRGNETFEVPLTLEPRPTGETGASQNGCQ